VADPGRKGLLARYSVEITANDVGALSESASLFPAGTRISVTFLPNEDTAARVRAVRSVRELGFVPVPHLPARRFVSSLELESFLDDLAGEARLDHCFVIAGDLDRPEGPYSDALSLIRTGLLEKYGVRHIGVAGYPEGHPKISKPSLQRAMWDKQRAARERGMSLSIVTQFGFEAAPVIDWLRHMRADGMHRPVYIGVAGPARAQTLLRFAARCGVGTSAKVLSKYGVSLAHLLNTAGPDSVVTQLERSLEQGHFGDVYLHFFPFGGVRRTADWIHRFPGIRGSR
jgi:methylenetetrahydrofolate reductase (NADPH)